MKEIRLDTPQGYFEESFERTMNSVAGIRRRRRAALCICAAIVLALCADITLRIGDSRDRKDYYAMETEMAQLDIFLEINDII